MMKKLKDFRQTGEFGIIDNRTHHYIEDLPREEAIAKYGECEVWSSYTAGFSSVPDADGRIPSFKTGVWIKIKED